MFKKIIDSGILGDYEYLFKKFEKAKKVYRRDVEKSNRVGKEVELYNDSFSETFFTSWVRNIFLRYSFLISKEENEKIEKFEKIHAYEKGCIISKESLSLYKVFKFVNINYIDLIEFSHSNSCDVLKLKLSVTCTGIIGENDANNPIDEQRSFYYDVEFAKDNTEHQINKTTDFTSNCPNCGAPTKISTFGVCDHCKEIVSTYDNVWKITKIELDN